MTKLLDLMMHLFYPDEKIVYLAPHRAGYNMIKIHRWNNPTLLPLMSSYIVHVTEDKFYD